ncbi:hypothetical protein FNV43_RR02722 [Rhamnella rubrinervis]|uniref:Uncharacterized protein n=1 Tax=Rhamnella rubrinervis TaxID=2594499 RepID=A0A8K0HHI9_9ROSA|nr:hypothetical protein FNV43_RR02722 [Rhamnella rubrinervis]
MLTWPWLGGKICPSFTEERNGDQPLPHEQYYHELFITASCFCREIYGASDLQRCRGNNVVVGSGSPASDNASADANTTINNPAGFGDHDRDHTLVEEEPQVRRRWLFSGEEMTFTENSSVEGKMAYMENSNVESSYKMPMSPNGSKCPRDKSSLTLYSAWG